MIGAKKPIRLENYKAYQDAKGDWKESLIQGVGLWADVTRKSGVRSEYAGQTALTNVVKFRVTFKPNVYPTGNWRVIYAGRKHIITSIERVNENRFEWDFISVSTGKR